MLNQSINNISREVPVVCGIIKNDIGQYLVCQRPPDKHLAYHWEFPGGKIEANEDLYTAIQRELKEELDIDVTPISALTPSTWQEATTTICLHPILCKLTQGCPKAIEHLEIRWCTPNEFKALTWAPADIPILSQIAPEWNV